MMLNIIRVGQSLRLPAKACRFYSYNTDSALHSFFCEDGKLRKIFVLFVNKVLQVYLQGWIYFL